jgi:hypothetical protein
MKTKFIAALIAAATHAGATIPAASAAEVGNDWVVGDWKCEADHKTVASMSWRYPMVASIEADSVSGAALTGQWRRPGEAGDPLVYRDGNENYIAFELANTPDTRLTMSRVGNKMVGQLGADTLTCRRK